MEKPGTPELPMLAVTLAALVDGTVVARLLDGRGVYEMTLPEASTSTVVVGVTVTTSTESVGDASSVLGDGVGSGEAESRVEKSVMVGRPVSVTVEGSRVP